jgi:hypothetical protein
MGVGLGQQIALCVFCVFLSHSSWRRPDLPERGGILLEVKKAFADPHHRRRKACFVVVWSFNSNWAFKGGGVDLFQWNFLHELTEDQWIFYINGAVWQDSRMLYQHGWMGVGREAPAANFKIFHWHLWFYVEIYLYDADNAKTPKETLLYRS